MLRKTNPKRGREEALAFAKAVVIKMDGKEERFGFTYRISLENYRDFNLMLVEYSMGKSRKKMRIFGILEVLVGILLLCSCIFSQGPGHALYYAMGFSLPVVGVFSLCYHTLIFPKQMKKSIERAYHESEYFAGELTVKLFDDRAEEQSGHLSGSAKWKDISQVVESERNLLIMMPGGRGIILPKEELGEKADAVSEFLKAVCKKNEKQYSVMKKKDSVA